MDPTHKEQELQRTAKLLLYVRKQLGLHVSRDVEIVATDQYAEVDFVPQLCALLKGLNPEQFKAVVYNAYDPTSRDLANWWEAHEAADRAREALEAQETERDQIRRIALTKLTHEEKEALGL